MKHDETQTKRQTCCINQIRASQRVHLGRERVHLHGTLTFTKRRRRGAAAVRRVQRRIEEQRRAEGPRADRSERIRQADSAKSPGTRFLYFLINVCIYSIYIGANRNIQKFVFIVCSTLVL